MTTIGLLYFRRHPKNCTKAYPFAAVAITEGVDFFYFSYKGVDFEQEKIHGWIYNKGKWEKEWRDFPDVVINSCTPKTDKQKEVSKKLRTKTTFTGHPVGHKMKVYRKILRGEKFASYLIPSLLLKAPKELIDLLKKEGKVVMKPNKGRHGKDIYIMEKKELYHVYFEENEAIMTELELMELVRELIFKKKWLIQPFINCVTKSGVSYDFRLHMQKNGKGQWEITLIYPRISGGLKQISNINSGGYRGELVPFLVNEFPDRWKIVRKKLEGFALEFTKHFESLYKHPFDELGLDVGLDENEQLWLFEVNWLPGSKHREWEVAKRLIPYCQYLVRKKGGE